MKTDVVRIGGLYLARMSGKIQVIRITAMHEEITPDGQSSLGMRFRAVNLATGQETFVKSPRRWHRGMTAPI